MYATTGGKYTRDPSFSMMEANRMATYMVERDLKGITMDQLAAAQRRAISTGQEMTATGKDVRYIRSTFVPGEARCMCLFESSNPAHVEELQGKAQIPFSRVVEALDLTP
jgi:Nickel responsive protein SCO4226-like